jgi:hypothetical protein
MKKFNFNKNPEDLKDYVFQWFKSYIRLDYDYKVSGEVFQERFDLCKACEHFNSEKIKCNECGCNLITKIMDSLESCPVSKWTIDEEGFKTRHYQEIVRSMPQDYNSFEIVND